MAVRRQKSTGSVVREETAAVESVAFDQTLRPRTLSEYVGQTKLKGHLLIHIQAAKGRNEPLGHTLLHGPPGLGKTTLAHIVAREMGSQCRITSGPVLEKPGDLASTLSNLQEGDVLFIDEVHRLRAPIEEMLYSAMEDCVLDLIIGKGPTARSMRLPLKPFTLIGATTRSGAMSAPFRDRFLHSFKLGFYELPEMQQIVERSGKILGIDLDPMSAMRVAKSARATPRIANRLVRAVRDFSQVRSAGPVTLASVEATLLSLGIDDDGLDQVDRAMLTAIIDSFQGGPVGLSTIAAILAEEEGTIEDVYEPYLIQQGYLQRTPKGRVASKRAYEKLGRNIPESAQAAML
jgi:Holliday junction DNA helicase RuvB